MLNVSYIVGNFGAEVHQFSEVLNKNVDLEVYSWLILFSLIIPVFFIITVNSAKQIF